MRPVLLIVPVQYERNYKDKTRWEASNMQAPPLQADAFRTLHLRLRFCFRTIYTKIMGVFCWIILGLLLFVYLRQLPSHKLHVLNRDLEEVRSYFTCAVEEGLLSGSYADDYRFELHKLQRETEKLRLIMMDVWPFSPRDFFHMLSGVTKQCYKLCDDIEIFRNKLRGTTSYERFHRDIYRITTPRPSTPTCGATTDDIVAMSTPTPSAPAPPSASAPLTPTYSMPAFATSPTPTASWPDKSTLTPITETLGHHCPPGPHLIPAIHTTYSL
ncbi:hypothetical protein VTO73DRAFT_2247 [Trametes versicolor]